MYEPGKNERLYDAPAARSATKVFLTFLQDKNNSSQVRVPEVFHCPEMAQYTKPKNYSELEYRIYNSELRMEFYLWMVGIFCHSSQPVFSTFARGKFTCATMVSNALMQFSSIQAKLILTTASMNFRLFDSFHVYRKTSILWISRFWFWISNIVLFSSNRAEFSTHVKSFFFSTGQMCGQDNYATGAEVHADWWEGLCTTALKLDLFDFIESGYALPR